MNVLQWVRQNQLLAGVAVALAGVYVALAIVLPDAGYDKYFWVTWTQDIINHGLGSIYLNPEANNQPLVMWLLWLFGHLFHNADAVTYGNINWLKLFIIPFDLIALFMVARKLLKTGRNVWWIALLAINPAFWYNTLVWGQIDTVHTTLVLLALIAAERGRWDLTWLSYIIALNVKLQAIIFLPLVVLLTLRPMRLSGFNARWRIWAGLGALQAVTLAPFVLSGHIVQTLEALAGRAIGFYPVLSRNAYNIYYLMARDPFNTPDTNVALGISVRWWGMALFALAALMVLLPFALTIINRAFNNLSRNERLATLAQSAALITLAFFLFNTQMHERYLHPAILFSGLYWLMGGQWWPYAMLSVGYLLNLEGVMHYLYWIDERIFGLKIDHASLPIFEPNLVAALLCGCFIMASAAFYRTFMAYRNNANSYLHTT